MARSPTNDPQIIGIIFGCIGGLLLLIILYGCYIQYMRGYNICSNQYTKKELFSILAHDPTLGEPVHRVEPGLYRVTGHKFLYPDRVPVDPNYFDGLMTPAQFAHVMVLINSAIIEACTDRYKSMMESVHSQAYTAANEGCRKATAYLQEHNIRAIVYQKTDYELRKYVNGFYQGTDWDTSINISFREQDLLNDFQVFLVMRETPMVQDSVPVAAVIPFVRGDEAEEFAQVPDGAVQKIARDLRAFYNRFDPSRTTVQIELAAKWATEHGLVALNGKLREKYGHDLTILNRELPV